GHEKCRALPRFSLRCSDFLGKAIVSGLHLLRTLLTSHPYCFSTSIGAVWLRACVSDQVELPVKSRNEHRAIVLIATWLISRKERWFAALRCHVPQPFTEATMAELGG